MAATQGLAIVTGGTRGIGRGIVRRLATDGYHVLFTYATNSAIADEVVAEVEGAGGRATAQPCDLGVNADIDALFARADALGEPFRLLVNNAAIWNIEPLETITEESFGRMVNTNMRGPLFMAQAAASRVVDNGRLIFISSVAAREAAPVYISYSMTKAALAAMVRGLAVLLGGRGVTVNALAPGLTETDLSALLESLDPAAITGAIAQTALQRIGTPGDIADAVSILARDESRWITGQVIDCSGGHML